jgi:hypothetical protein
MNTIWLGLVPEHILITVSREVTLFVGLAKDLSSRPAKNIIVKGYKSQPYIKNSQGS